MPGGGSHWAGRKQALDSKFLVASDSSLTMTYGDIMSYQNAQLLSKPEVWPQRCHKVRSLCGYHSLPESIVHFYKQTCSKLWLMESEQMSILIDISLLMQTIIGSKLRKGECSTPRIE